MNNNLNKFLTIWWVVISSLFVNNPARAEIHALFDDKLNEKLQHIKNSKENDDKYQNTKDLLNEDSETLLIIDNWDFIDSKISSEDVMKSHPFIVNHQDYIQEIQSKWYKIVLINLEWVQLLDELLKTKPNWEVLQKLSKLAKTRIINIDKDNTLSDANNIVSVSTEINKLWDLVSKGQINEENATKLLDDLIAKTLWWEADQEQIDMLLTEMQTQSPNDISKKYWLIFFVLLSLIWVIINQWIKLKSKKYNQIKNIDDYMSESKKLETSYYNNYINEKLLSEENIRKLLKDSELKTYRYKISEILFNNPTELEKTKDINTTIKVLKDFLKEWKKENIILMLSILNESYFAAKEPMGKEINSEEYQKIASFFVEYEYDIKQSFKEIVNIEHNDNESDDELLNIGIKSIKEDLSSNKNYILAYMNLLSDENAKYIYKLKLNHWKSKIDNLQESEATKNIYRKIKLLFELAKNKLIEETQDTWQESDLYKKLSQKYYENIYFWTIIKSYKKIAADLPKYKENLDLDFA